MRAFQTLIVEDNESFRVSLASMLTERFPRMSVKTAVSKENAIDVARRIAPDLVFMDVRLPDGNGLDAARVIKTQFDEAVIIVLTAFDFPEYREAAYRCGAGYYLAKGKASREDIIGAVEFIMGADDVS